MEIKFIGTESIKGHCTSYIIDHHILFDCGFGTVRTMCDNNLDENIDTVIISHLHPDHIGDIIYLILTCFVKKRQNIKIIAPSGTREFIKNLNFSTFCGDLKDNLSDYFNYFNGIIDNLIELSDNQIYKDKVFNLRAFRVIHGFANSNAYIINIKGKTIGCSGDTSYCTAIKYNIPCATTWIIDTTHNQTTGNKHLSLEKLEFLARQNAKTQFYAVHGSGYKKETTCKNIYFPKDGTLINV